MAIYSSSGTVTSSTRLSSAMNTFTTNMPNYSAVFNNGASGTPSYGVTALDTHSLCIHHIKSQMNFIWTAGSTAESDSNPANSSLRNFYFLNAKPWKEDVGGVTQYAEDESYMRGYMMTDPDPRANHVPGVGNNSPQASVRFGQHEVVAAYQSSTSIAQGGLLGAGPFYKKLGTQVNSVNSQDSEVYSDTQASNSVCQAYQMPGCEGIKFADGVNYNFYGGDGLGGSSDYFHMVLEIRTGIFSHWWSGQIDSAIDTDIIPGDDDRFGGFMGCSGPFVAIQYTSGGNTYDRNGAQPVSQNPMTGGSHGFGNTGSSVRVRTNASILHFPEGPNPQNWEGERGDATRGPNPNTGFALTEGQAIDFGGAISRQYGADPKYLLKQNGGLVCKQTSDANASYHTYNNPGQGSNISSYTLDRLVTSNHNSSNNMYFGANWVAHGVAIGWNASGYDNTTPEYGRDYLYAGNDPLSGRTFLGSNLCILQDTNLQFSYSTAQGLYDKDNRSTLLGSYPGVHPVNIKNFLAREVLTVGTDLYDTYPQIRKSTDPSNEAFKCRNSYDQGGAVQTVPKCGYGESAGDNGAVDRIPASGWMGYAYAK